MLWNDTLASSLTTIKLDVQPKESCKFHLYAETSFFAALCSTISVQPPTTIICSGNLSSDVLFFCLHNIAILCYIGFWVIGNLKSSWNPPNNETIHIGIYRSKERNYWKRKKRERARKNIEWQNFLPFQHERLTTPFWCPVTFIVSLCRVEIPEWEWASPIKGPEPWFWQSHVGGYIAYSLHHNN